MGVVNQSSLALLPSSHSNKGLGFRVEGTLDPAFSHSAQSLQLGSSSLLGVCGVSIETKFQIHDDAKW